MTGVDWTAAATIDARELNCPLPVLKARKALAGLRPGQRLLVLATDPMAAIDMPNLCRETANRLIASETAGDVLRYLIERQ